MNKAWLESHAVLGFFLCFKVPLPHLINLFPHVNDHSLEYVAPALAVPQWKNLQPSTSCRFQLNKTMFRNASKINSKTRLILKQLLLNIDSDHVMIHITMCVSNYIKKYKKISHPNSTFTLERGRNIRGRNDKYDEGCDRERRVIKKNFVREIK